MLTLLETINEIRAYGFTLAKARTLAGEGLRPDDLPRLFAYEGRRTPLCVALHAESDPRALRAVLAAFREAAYEEVRVAQDEAERIVREAREKAARQAASLAVDVLAGDQIAHGHDRRCAPVQRLHVGRLTAIVDFDLGSARVSYDTAGVCEIELGGPWGCDEIAPLVDMGAPLGDARELADEIEQSYAAWSREFEHLRDRCDYSDAEIRSLLMSRALMDHPNQLALAPEEPDGAILKIRRPGLPAAVAVYPEHCWGRPVLMSSRGVAVEDVVSRVRAGDTIEAVAADMGLTLVDAREAYLVGHVLEHGHMPAGA